ncbi:hypothetical protein J3A83DRAFT_4375764 [Scleroderma citrinum]
MFGLPCSIWLIIFTFLGSVCTYTIDDSNYSVLKFSENPAGPVWGPFGSDTGEQLSIRLPNGTMMAINSAQCYDGTLLSFCEFDVKCLRISLTDAACSTSNNCAVQFSFTGSGITIYVLQAGPQGMSASLSIDSGSATTATLAAPPAPQYNIPHVVLFSVQNLVSGTHTAIMTVLDWDGGFSGMMLDYIDVNEAVVVAPSSTTSNSNPSTTTSTPTPTSTSSPSSSASSQNLTSQSTQVSLTTLAPSIASSLVNSASLHGQSAIATSSAATGGGGGNASSELTSSSNKSHVAAIAGGTIAGGVGLLALCGLALFCFRRRRSRSDSGITPLLNDRPTSRFLFGPVADPFARATTNDPSFSSVTVADVARTSLRDAEAIIPDRGGTSPRSLPLSGQLAGHLSDGSPGQGSVIDISQTTARGSASPDTQPTPRLLPAIPVLPSPTSWPNEKASSSREAGQGAIVATSEQSGNQPVLTDEQADFVTSLYQNNVPVAVVARVLERMLANPNPQGAGPGSAVGAHDPELRQYMGNGQPVPPVSHARDMSWFDGRASQFGDGETTIGTAPPSYDYARAQ